MGKKVKDKHILEMGMFTVTFRGIVCRECGKGSMGEFSNNLTCAEELIVNGWAMKEVNGKRVPLCDVCSKAHRTIEN